MHNDVGKTTATIKLNDYVISMVNASIPDSVLGGLRIYEESGRGTEKTLRYNMIVDQTAFNNRCLQFTRSHSGDAMHSSLRPVIYLPQGITDAGTGGVTCIPLYECICPVAQTLMAGNYQLTWWSNMKEMPETNGNGTYIYDYTKLYKFNTSTLSGTVSSSSVAKVLCTAPVHWERLQYEGYDNRVYNTPIIKDVAILDAITGEGLVVDFTGGDGGGMRVHSHLNTMDGGFAGAVFMPSASPRMMSWM